MRYEEIPDFFRKLPEIELPIAGARGWMLQGASEQAVAVEFAETVEVPEHTHEDQWEIPLTGKVELRREGRTEVRGPGDVFFVPAGQPHEATVHAGYKAVIIFAAADRYVAKK